MFETNFLREITKMRKDYCKHPYEEKHIPKPSWLKPEDELSRIYQEYQTLFSRGQIYYGCIVQANTILFEDYPPIDCPAHLIFSPDAAVDDNPHLLQCVANAVMLYKNTPIEEAPEKIRSFVEIVGDEMSRKGAVQRFEFEDGTQITVHLKSMIVFRKYLPEKKITSAYHPILANLGECESVITLPKEYWTRKIVKYRGEKQ